MAGGSIGLYETRRNMRASIISNILFEVYDTLAVLGLWENKIGDFCGPY